MTAHTAITAQDVCAWPVFGDERLAQNFWDKLVIEQNSGCWLWTAAGNTRGYGNAYANGAYINAHKLVFEALVGKVPAGLQLDHLCRVRCCANPSHLEIVTPRENTLRGNSQSAHQARATHCQNGHEFKAPRLIGGKLSRRCRECDRQREARYRKAVRSSDRGDGFHANDPAAPVLFRCDGCDAPRETDARCFCPDCNEVTGCYADTKPLYSPEFF